MAQQLPQSKAKTAVSHDEGATTGVRQEGGRWIVELVGAGGRVQRFECATEAMARMLLRSLEKPPPRRS